MYGVFPYIARGEDYQTGISNFHMQAFSDWHPFVKAIPNLMQMDILKGKMAMVEARAGFDVAIMLNPRRHAEMIGQGRQPSLVCPLEEYSASFRKEMGAKLCRSLMELLVSAHTKYVRHEWIGHNFTYYFEDRLRYM